MSYKKKVALIFGISGQDGIYLSKLLIDKNYRVIGTSRTKRNQISDFKKVGIKKKISIHKVNPQNEKAVMEIIKKTQCNEIYYFSGISSVSYSFQHPEETLMANTRGIINILESCRQIDKKIKIYNASTGECFGSSKKAFDENSKFSPNSPYALSKTLNSYIVKNYRDNLGMWVVNGFSFNHDSPLRPKNYILKKISNYVKVKPKKKLEVGNINISRDWSWAPEHVNFIYKIMQLNKPEDFIIATGNSRILKNLINHFFKSFNIKRNNIKINKKFFRKNDIKFSNASPKKLKKKFNIIPNTNVETIINNMINNKFF